MCLQAYLRYTCSVTTNFPASEDDHRYARDVRCENVIPEEKRIVANPDGMMSGAPVKHDFTLCKDAAAIMEKTGRPGSPIHEAVRRAMEEKGACQKLKISSVYTPSTEGKLCEKHQKQIDELIKEEEKESKRSRAEPARTETSESSSSSVQSISTKDFYKGVEKARTASGLSKDSARPRSRARPPSPESRTETGQYKVASKHGTPATSFSGGV